MKDYSMIRETLNVLCEIQEMLKDKIERSQETYNNGVIEFEKYSKNNDGTYSYTDENGEIIERNHWDYDYAKRSVSEYQRELQAYETVMDYLEKYKLG